jgi:hypothetical protein
MASEDGYSYFGVNVGVTPEGLQHADDIIDIVLQYVRMLRETGPQVRKWRRAETVVGPARLVSRKAVVGPARLVARLGTCTGGATAALVPRKGLRWPRVALRSDLRSLRRTCTSRAS